MTILLVAALTMVALLYTVFTGGFIGFPLLLGLGLFSLLAKIQGTEGKAILKYQLLGAKKALVVLRVFMFIGGITGLWMISGTVPALINLGLSLIHPQFFILFAFLIPAVLSYLMGTSFGTVSTVGIALMVIARGAGLSEALVGGAIISGAYFGDRNSPMSSSANLVAGLTGTDLHRNVVLMFKTGLLPLILTTLLYGFFSFTAPLQTGEMPMLSDLQATFSMGLVPLLPAIVMLVLSLLKIDVKWAMGSSIVIAALVALGVQGASLQAVFQSALTGFYLPAGHPLATLIKGGGLLSMLKPAIIVTTACALAGLLEGTGMLAPIEKILSRAKGPFGRFSATFVTSIGAASFGCNQTIAVVLTDQLMTDAYEKADSQQDLAIDLENSAILLAALVPWNIAAFVPTTTLGISSTAYIPFAFFLYLVPLVHFVRRYHLGT